MVREVLAGRGIPLFRNRKFGAFAALSQGRSWQGGLDSSTTERLVVTTWLRCAVVLGLVSVLFVSLPLSGNAQAPDEVVDAETLVPPLPKSVTDRIPDLQQRHLWIPNDAPWPWNMTAAQGSYKNSNGGTAFVQCLIEVGSDNPNWAQEDMRYTRWAGGARCNIQMQAITGTSRLYQWNGANGTGPQVDSVAIGAQTEVPPDHGSGWQAYGLDYYNRTSNTQYLQIKVEVTLEIKTFTDARWNSYPQACTRDASNGRVLRCELWSVPFQHAPYPCPTPEGKVGMQPGGCVSVCPAPYVGVDSDCATLGEILEDVLAPTAAIQHPWDYYRALIGDADDGASQTVEGQEDAVDDSDPVSDVLQGAADDINDDSELTDEQIWAGHEANVQAIEAAGGPPETLLYPDGSGSSIRLVERRTMRSDDSSSSVPGGYNLNDKEREYCKNHIVYCLEIDSAREYAFAFRDKYYQGKYRKDGYKGNAYLHCTWIGVSAVSVPDDEARHFGELHESGPRPPGRSPERHRLHKLMDLHNNNEGIYYQTQTSGSVKRRSNKTSRRCRNNANDGTLWRIRPRPPNFPTE